MTPNRPKWLSDFRRLMAVRSGFVIAGRHLDKTLPLEGQQQRLATNAEVLEKAMEEAGIVLLVTYDIVGGMRVKALGDFRGSLNEFGQALGIARADEAVEILPKVFADRLVDLEMAQRQRTPAERFRYGVIVEYGARLLQAGDVVQILAGLMKRCDDVQPVIVGGKAMNTPLVMWVENIEAVPAWFLTGSQLIEALTVTQATYDQRREAVDRLAFRLESLKQLDAEPRKAVLEDLTARSSVLSLTDLDDLTSLGRTLKAATAEELVRGYQLGDASLENPWKSTELRRRVANSEEVIGHAVLGQPRAIARATDILKRAVVGLSGAQAKSSPNRPRGILFLAGPTGTGKTELAKQIAKVVFGDPEAYIRFDMSEYTSEHHEARLVGAPPGYTGFDAGGQLTNAVRARPFSVILFDEIEKAHPQILDKFLQILEDGRITDGRGQTAYFSEAVLVFTSNLGTYMEDPVTRKKVPQVSREMAYKTLEDVIRTGIESEFRNRMGRPELLNRFGENIVIFDFISREVGERILANYLVNVTMRVREEHGLDLVLSSDAKAQIFEACLSDRVLDHGGRGIKNMLEPVLIDPLSRELINRERFSGSIRIETISIDPQNGAYVVDAR